MKSSKCESMPWLLKHKKFQMMVGQCKMVPLGRDHPGMIQVNTSVHTKLPSIVKVLLVIVFGANDVWFHLFSGIFGAKWRA